VDQTLDKITTQHNTEEPRELIKKGNKEISEVEVKEFTIEDVKKGNKKLKK